MVRGIETRTAHFRGTLRCLGIPQSCREPWGISACRGVLGRVLVGGFRAFRGGTCMGGVLLGFTHFLRMDGWMDGWNLPCVDAGLGRMLAWSMSCRLGNWETYIWYSLLIIPSNVCQLFISTYACMHEIATFEAGLLTGIYYIGHISSAKMTSRQAPLAGPGK